jgi:metal-sulfur cluster biosynthetic enzyme
MGFTSLIFEFKYFMAFLDEAVLAVKAVKVELPLLIPWFTDLMSPEALDFIIFDSLTFWVK